MRFPKINSRIKYSSALLLLCATFVGQALAPVIQSAHAASVPAVDLLAFGTTFNNALNNNLSSFGCQPYYSSDVESDAYIQTQVGVSRQQLQAIDTASTQFSSRPTNTNIGPLISADFTKQQLEYILNQAGHSITTIKFKPYNQPIDGVSLFDNTDSECKKFTMIPVSSTEWRGFQGNLTDTLTNTTTHRYMIYTKGSNILNYYHVVNSGKTVNFDSANIDISSAGAAPGTGGNYANHITPFYWINSTQLRLEDPSSKYNGEIYTRSSWNNAGDYYLTGASKTGTDRTAQTLDAAGQSNTCSLDKSCVNDDGTPIQTVVPFVHLDTDISFKDHDIKRLHDAMLSLGNSKGKYYNFETNFQAIGPQTGNYITSTNGSLENPKIWFAYSLKNKSFVPLLASGASNETPYVGGTYKLKTGTTGAYLGPGDGGCEGLIEYSGTPSAKQVFNVKWTLYREKCQNPYDPLQGDAPMAIADESLFTAAQTNIDTITQAKTSATATAAPKLECEYSIINPLTWFICPLVSAAQALVGQLDDAINQQLFIRSDNIFNRTDKNTQASANAYYNAWLTFRGIGLGLVAIGGLVSIIAFALGFEFLDAYTVRKVLPRLIIAVIGMSLSWYIMQYLVEFSNSIGLGIRSLIYAPFSTVGAVAKGGGLSQAQITLGGGSSFALSLIGGGAALALGLVGLLSLGLTAAIAVAIGFGTIIVRNILITLLIVLAPFAIACAILPNTQKAWKLWSDTFTKALLVFPIITAFIAAGRVFALLTSAGGDAGVLTGLISFVAYFAPYFLIATAFKLAGGVIGTIGGIANNKSRGVFDRLKKQRGNRIASNMQRMGSGSRFQDSNILARNFNRATVGAATGARGRFGLGARGAEAVAIRKNVAAEQNFKSNAALQQLALNNDDAIAVLALSGGSARGAQEAARDLFGADTVRADRALNGAAAVGFSSQNAASAFVGMAQNKSRAVGDGDMAVVERGIARLSNGNAAVANSTRGGFQYNSRNAGRFDLGDNDLEAAWARTNSYQLASSGTPHAIRAFSDHWESELTQGTQAYTAAAATGDRPAMQASMQRVQRAKTAQIEMEAMKSNATVENADILNAATGRMADTDRVFHGEMVGTHGALREGDYDLRTDPTGATPLPTPDGRYHGPALTDVSPRAQIERDLRDLQTQSQAAARVPEQFDPRRNP